MKLGLTGFGWLISRGVWFPFSSSSFFGGHLVCFERAVLAFLSSEKSARAVLMTMMMMLMVMVMSWVLRWFDARLLPVTTL